MATGRKATGRGARALRRTGRRWLRRSGGDLVQFEVPSLQYLDFAYSLDHVSKIVARAIGDVARAVDATAGQLQVIAAVARVPDGLTAKQIAAALAIRPGSLTGMLDKLEMRGAIARIPVPGDARQARIVLREPARPLVDALIKVDTEVQRLLAPLGVDALQRMADLAVAIEDQLRGDVGVPVPAALRSTSPDGIKLPKLRDDDPDARPPARN